MAKPGIWSQHSGFRLHAPDSYPTLSEITEVCLTDSVFITTPWRFPFHRDKDVIGKNGVVCPSHHVHEKERAHARYFFPEFPQNNGSLPWNPIAPPLQTFSCENFNIWWIRKNISHQWYLIYMLLFPSELVWTHIKVIIAGMTYSSGVFTPIDQLNSIHIPSYPLSLGRRKIFSY